MKKIILFLAIVALLSSGCFEKAFRPEPQTTQTLPATNSAEPTPPTTLQASLLPSVNPQLTQPTRQPVTTAKPTLKPVQPTAQTILEPTPTITAEFSGTLIVGQIVRAKNGMTVELADISPPNGFPSARPRPLFHIYDQQGTLVDSVRLEGGSDYTKNGVTIKVLEWPASSERAIVSISTEYSARPKTATAVPSLTATPTNAATPTITTVPTASPTTSATPTPTLEILATPAPIPPATPGPTPFPIPQAAGAYMMKSYVEGFLDSSTTDDRIDSLTGPLTILGGYPSASGGRKISNSDTPAAFSGTVVDQAASRTYNEKEDYYVYAKTQYDSISSKVKARNPQVAYEAIFTNPIQVCTEFTPDDSTCSDTYKTSKHRLTVKLFSQDWVITALDDFPADGSISTISRISLGREAQYNEFMQVNDQINTPSGVKVRLAAFNPPLNQMTSVSFEVKDANGNVIDTTTLQQDGEYNRNGIVIRVFQVFAGLGQTDYAKVSVFTDRLTLQHGSSVNQDNAAWRVDLVGGGPSFGASLQSIRLTKVVTSDLNPGDSISFIDRPEVMKFSFNGLEDVTYDRLLFVGTEGDITTQSFDQRAIGQSMVRIYSSRAGAFDVGTTTTSVLYYIVDNQNQGAAKKGKLFFQKPPSNHFEEYRPQDATVAADGSVTINYVRYAYGASSVRLQFNSQGIDLGSEPNSANGAVIAIPEYLTLTDEPNKMGAFVIDVGAGDSSQPKLTASAGTFTTGYLSAYTPGASLTGASQQGITFVSPRGSRFESIGLFQIELKYAVTLSQAIYALWKTG